MKETELSHWRWDGAKRKAAEEFTVGRAQDFRWKRRDGPDKQSAMQTLFPSRPLLVPALLVWCLAVGCGKRGPSAPHPGETPTVESTAEAEATRIAEPNAGKRQVRPEIGEMKSQELILKQEIAKLEKYREIVRHEVDDTTAQTEQLSKEVEELRKRRKTELEGLLEHDVRPLEEVVKRMTREINQLLEENRELKRQLAETNK